MTRPRLSLRLAMVLVAVAAIPLTLLERRNRFQRMMADHASEQRKLIRQMPGGCFAGSMTDPFYPHALHHLHMTKKYERAACSPWLPVEPDPPDLWQRH